MLLAAVALIGVASARGGTPAWYTVRHGDNLTRIARLLGVKIVEIQRENGLSGSLLLPAQRLRVPEPLRDLEEGSLRWRRPHGVAPGPVLRGFGPQQVRHGVRVTHTGIDVAVPLGTPVHAPATGVVRYCGPQEGFGVVAIIEHAAGWSSVLAPLEPDSARCRAGEIVLRGDVIGRTAAPEEGTRPCLHVELRRGREAVSPQRLLR